MVRGRAALAPRLPREPAATDRRTGWRSDEERPAPIVSGMIEAWVNSKGELRRFRAVPPQVDASAAPRQSTRRSSRAPPASIFQNGRKPRPGTRRSMLSTG